MKVPGVYIPYKAVVRGIPHRSRQNYVAFEGRQGPANFVGLRVNGREPSKRFESHHGIGQV